MQISTNSYAREVSLAYQTTQKPQENITSFDMLLSAQSNQANNLGENQAAEPKTLGEIIGHLMLNGDNSANWIFVSIRQAAHLEAESLYGGFKNGDSKADRTHNQQVGDKAHEIWSQWINETDANKIQKIIESSLNALKNSVHNNGVRLDEFGNLSPLPQHIFEAEKSKAIDILSEILQEIKA